MSKRKNILMKMYDVVFKYAMTKYIDVIKLKVINKINNKCK